MGGLIAKLEDHTLNMKRREGGGVGQDVEAQVNARY